MLKSKDTEPREPRYISSPTGEMFRLIKTRPLPSLSSLLSFPVVNTTTFSSSSISRCVDTSPRGIVEGNCYTDSLLLFVAPIKKKVSNFDEGEGFRTHAISHLVSSLEINLNPLEYSLVRDKNNNVILDERLKEIFDQKYRIYYL